MDAVGSTTRPRRAGPRVNPHWFLRCMTVVTAGLLACGILMLPTSAHAASTIHVTGTVTNARDSNPVPGVAVDFRETSAAAVASTSTSTDGTYAVDVPAGTYDVSFTPAGNSYAPTTLHG